MLMLGTQIIKPCDKAVKSILGMGSQASGGEPQLNIDICP